MNGLRRHFFARHLAYILLPVLIPVIAFGVLILVMTDQAARDDLRAESQEHAKLIDETLSYQVIQDIQHKVLLYSNTDSNSAYAVLENVLRNNRAPFEVYQKYKIVCSNITADLAVKPLILRSVFYAANKWDGYYEQGVKYLRPSDRSWFSTGQTLEPSKLHLEKSVDAAGRTTLAVFYRINSRAFWVVWYDYNALMRAMTVADLPNGSRFYVTDTQGRLLFSLNGSENELPFLDTSTSAGDVVKLENGEYFTSSRENTAFRVYVLTPLANSTPGHMSTLWIFSVCLLGSLFACVLMAIWFAQREYAQLKTVLSLLENPGSALRTRSPELRNEYSRIVDGAVAQYVRNTQMQIELTERKHQLELAQLGALQYQINPHFILNTLQVVDFEILRAIGHYGAANEMILSLGALLDYSLHSPTALVQLRQEIRVTEEYIRILRFRYEGLFDAVWDYAPDVLDWGVPKLLLQPLIENCVLHGLRARTSTQKGMVIIQLRRQRKHLLVRVLDNGVGISRDELCHLRKEIEQPGLTKRGSIGLRNVRQRLLLLFGENGEFKIYSHQGRGTLFHIRFPLMQHGDMLPLRETESSLTDILK